MMPVAYLKAGAPASYQPENDVPAVGDIEVSIPRLPLAEGFSEPEVIEILKALAPRLAGE